MLRLRARKKARAGPCACWAHWLGVSPIFFLFKLMRVCQSSLMSRSPQPTHPLSISSSPLSKNGASFLLVLRVRRRRFQESFSGLSKTRAPSGIHMARKRARPTSYRAGFGCSHSRLGAVHHRPTSGVASLSTPCAVPIMAEEAPQSVAFKVSLFRADVSA